jgi:hypothetical protein
VFDVALPPKGLLAPPFARLVITVKVSFPVPEATASGVSAVVVSTTASAVASAATNVVCQP